MKQMCERDLEKDITDAGYHVKLVETPGGGWVISVNSCMTLYADTREAAIKKAYDYLLGD